MKKVVVCIGSSCHLKGSRQVVEELQKLIDQNNLKEEVELAGTFCMGNCQKGVSVKLNDQLFSVSPQTVKEFFENEILKTGEVVCKMYAPNIKEIDITGNISTKSYSLGKCFPKAKYIYLYDWKLKKLKLVNWIWHLFAKQN